MRARHQRTPWRRNEWTDGSWALLDRSDALILVTSQGRRILYANQKATSTFARSGQGSLVGTPLRALHGSEDSFADFETFSRLLPQQQKVRTEWALRLPDGTLHWFDIQGAFLRPGHPGSGIVWTLFDTDDHHRLDTALMQAEHRLALIVEKFPAGALITEAGEQTIVTANEAMYRVLHIPPSTRLVGAGVTALSPYLPAHILHQIYAPLPRFPIAFAQPIAPYRGVYEWLDGRFIDVEGIPLHDGPDLHGGFWIFRDVSAQWQRERRLEKLATTDALTGILNRHAFLEILDRELDMSTAPGPWACTLMILDVDFFKTVNDSYGHPTGDVVLQHLANTVKRFLAPDDVFGRLGGEEFAILLRRRRADGAYELAEQIRQAIAGESVAIAPRPAIHYTVSIGLYEAPPEGAAATQFLARADAALYASKHAGRNRTTLWTPALMEASGPPAP